MTVMLNFGISVHNILLYGAPNSWGGHDRKASKLPYHNIHMISLPTKISYYPHLLFHSSIAPLCPSQDMAVLLLLAIQGPLL